VGVGSSSIFLVVFDNPRSFGGKNRRETTTNFMA
jgi:hypothetical protein